MKISPVLIRNHYLLIGKLFNITNRYIRIYIIKILNTIKSAGNKVRTVSCVNLNYTEFTGSRK